jgi:hypothetical protein
MDMLQQLVENITRIGRTNEPNRVALTAVDEYLNDKAGIVRLSLERVCDAIDREEAEKRPIEDWSIAKDYARSRGAPKYLVSHPFRTSSGSLAGRDPSGLWPDVRQRRPQLMSAHGGADSLETNHGRT